MNLRAIHVTALMGGALIFQSALTPLAISAPAPAGPRLAKPFVPETPQETASRLMAEQWLAIMRSWFKGGTQFVANNPDRAGQPIESIKYPPAPWTQRPLCGPVALAHHLAPLLPVGGSQPSPEEWLNLYANNEQRARHRHILTDISRVFAQRGLSVAVANEAAKRQVLTRWDLYEHLIKFGTPDPRHQTQSGARNPYDPSAISSDATDYYNLGLICQRMGNFKDAAIKYERATRSRHAMAQASLAYLYETGQGVPRDLMKALELYQLAAQQGHSVAQYNLGRIHQNGLKNLKQVITPNPALAEQYLRRAAAQGVVAAYHQLGILYHTQAGRVNLATLTPEQLKTWDKNGDGKVMPSENRLYQDAHDHFLLATRQAYGPSLHALGVMYQKGQGVKPDLARAAHWLEQAVKHEQPDSYYNLAQLHENGLGVPPNLPRAFMLYRQAARMGHAPSQYNLGLFYYQGRVAGEQVTLTVPTEFATRHPAAAVPAELAKTSAMLASTQASYLPVPGKDQIQRLELLVPAGQGRYATEVLSKWATAGQPDEEPRKATHKVLGGNDPVRAYAWWSLAAHGRQQAAITGRDSLKRLLTPEQLRAAHTLSAHLQAELAAPKPPSPMVDAQSRTSFAAQDWSTGFFVSKNGYVIAGKHLKHSGTRFQVVTENGSFPAREVNLQQGDLGQYLLLKVDGDYQFPTLSLNFSHGTRNRDPVQVLGNQFPFAKQGTGPRAALAETRIGAILGAQADPRFFTLHNPVLGDRLVFTFESYLDKPGTPNAPGNTNAPDGDALYRLQQTSLKRLKGTLHAAHNLLANADLRIGYVLTERMWYDAVNHHWHQIQQPQAREFAAGEWVILDNRRVREAPPLTQVEDGRALLQISVMPGLVTQANGKTIRISTLVENTLIGPFNGLKSDLNALEKALGDSRINVVRRTPGFRGAALLNNQGQAIGLFFPGYSGRAPDVFQNFSSYHKYMLKADHLIGFLNHLPDVRYHTRAPALPQLATGEKINFDSRAYLLAKAGSAMVLVQVAADVATVATKVATKRGGRP